MVDEIKNKKIDNVKNSSGLDQIRKSEAVGQVDRSKEVSGVSGIDANKRGITREMTAAEREHLLAMVNEEAEKIFGKSGIPAEQREIIESAVKQTIEAAIIEDEGSEDNDEDSEDKD